MNPSAFLRSPPSKPAPPRFREWLMVGVIWCWLASGCGRHFHREWRSSISMKAFTPPTSGSMPSRVPVPGPAFVRPAVIALAGGMVDRLFRGDALGNDARGHRFRNADHRNGLVARAKSVRHRSRIDGGGALCFQRLSRPLQSDRVDGAAVVFVVGRRRCIFSGGRWLISPAGR